MKSVWLALVLSLFFVGCADDPIHISPTISDENITDEQLTNRIATRFDTNWCESRAGKPWELTVERLLALANNANCFEAGKILAVRDSVSLSSIQRADKITAIQPLSEFVRIRDLNLYGNQLDELADLMPLRYLKKLESLDIGDNGLTEVYGISNFIPTTTTLKLSKNELKPRQISTLDDQLFSMEDRLNLKVSSLDLSSTGLTKIPLLPLSLKKLVVQELVLDADGADNILEQNLSHIDLRGTKFPEEILSKIQQKSPDVQIQQNSFSPS